MLYITLRAIFDLRFIKIAVAVFCNKNIKSDFKGFLYLKMGLFLKIFQKPCLCIYTSSVDIFVANLAGIKLVLTFLYKNKNLILYIGYLIF